MKDKIVDLSSLKNLELGPNWERIPKKNNKEFKNGGKKTKRFNDKKREKQTSLLYQIDITYEHEIMSQIKNKIRESGITYSVEEITNTLISDKKRLTFKIEALNKEKLNEVIFDKRIFHTKKGAIEHITRYGLDSLIEISNVKEEKPTGNFKNILKCKITNKLLPPKNYHEFENCIYQHLYENKINRNYNDFVNGLETVTETEIIEDWKNQTIEKVSYGFKTILKSEKEYESIKHVTKEIEKSFHKFINEKNKITISGSKINKLDTIILEQIIEFYEKNQKWKKDLFFNILINLKKSGFYIFKDSEKNILFASPVKARKVKEKEISQNCLCIINEVKHKKIISKKDLLNAQFKYMTTKDKILYEVKWLLREGYIKEFKNGDISIN